MKAKKLLLHALALCGFAFTSHAGSIGVNVGPNDPANEIGPTTTAGVVAQDNWNNLLGGNVAATQVTDDSGTLLATTVQVQTQWSYQTGATGGGGDQILMDSALDHGGGEHGFVVTGIPYASYDVIIYHEGASDGGRGGDFFIRDTDNGNTIVATQPSYDVTAFDGTFVDASTVGDPPGSGLDSNGDPVNSNYVRFNGLSLANIGIRSVGNNPPGIATPRAPIAGIQIIEGTPDTDPPTPDPMTFASIPAATSDSQITMTATTATDATAVEYYFTETSGNPGGDDSGWQDSETYTDTGLNPSTTYTYTVKARDKSAAQNETAESGPESATTDSADTTAPSPDPMTFASVPAATSETEITMTATTATDVNGVEYYFAETSGNPGGADSGWQDSEVYTNDGLVPGTTYTYTVTARDKSGAQNETAPSAAESATTDPDTTAPSPDPMTFATLPFGLSATEISMTATTATDDLTDVEYYFAETSGNPGGADSGWQDSPTYVNSGLTAGTTYTYTVKARDKSAAQNETAVSSPESADTAPPITVGTMIGVNTGPAGQEIGAADMAGVVPQVYWNNKMSGNFGATQVTDNGGTLLATTVSVQTQWSYTTGAGGSGGDQILMNSALDNGGGEMGFVVTGIPYAAYDVIIYHEGASNAGRGGAFFIRDTDNGGNIVATQNSYDVTNFDGTYVEASTVGVGGSGLDENGDPVNSNYIRFNGLTLANIGIRSDAANPAGIPTDRAPLAGFQIIEASLLPGGDYGAWAGGFPDADLIDPDADLDGDGLSNDNERLFGLDPTDPASQNPYVVPLDAGAGTFSFTRRDDSLTGMISTVEYSTDLQTWMIDEGAVLSAGAPDGNNIETVSVTLSAALLTANNTLFARVAQAPLPPLLSEDFEDDDGAFTATVAAGTAWEYGAPMSSDNGGTPNFGGSVTEGNGGSANAWGTNLGNPGYYADPTTDSCLRSPDIDLTGVTAAELTFAEALDVEGSDSAVLKLINADGDVDLGTIYTAVDGDQNSADWQAANGGTPIDLSAGVGLTVYLQWCLSGTGGASDDYMGWYIDDVLVTGTPAP